MNFNCDDGNGRDGGNCYNANDGDGGDDSVDGDGGDDGDNKPGGREGGRGAIRACDISCSCDWVPPKSK